MQKYHADLKSVGAEIKKIRPAPIDIKGHHIAASKDHPEYLVKSDKFGKQADHKPDALEKIEQ